jgi:hypothetical protein
MTDTINQPTATDTVEQLAVTVPAGRLALAWKYVRRACDRTEYRPALECVAIDVHDNGIRLAATDSFVLLHCWVGAFADPGLDVDPIATLTVRDDGDLARRFVRSVTRLDPTNFVEITTTDKTVSFNYDQTGVTVRRWSGEYPNWRRLVRGEGDGPVYTPAPTETIRLGPEIVARAIARPRHSTGPKLTFSGEEGPVLAEWTDLAVPLRGLIMPRRADA